MRGKRIWAVLLSFMFLMSCLVGCGGDGEESSQAAETSQGASDSEESQSTAEDDPYAAGDFTYPMDGTVTLSINMTVTAEEELPE